MGAAHPIGMKRAAPKPKAKKKRRTKKVVFHSAKQSEPAESKSKAKAKTAIELALDNRSILFTGVRGGMYLRGWREKNKDLILRYHGQGWKPNQKYLPLVERGGIVPFNEDEDGRPLDESRGDLIGGELDEGDRSTLEIISLGNSKGNAFMEISDEERAELLESGRRWKARDIMKYIPNKNPISYTENHTLILLKEWFQIDQRIDQIKTSGSIGNVPIIHLDNGFYVEEGVMELTDGLRAYPHVLAERKENMMVVAYGGDSNMQRAQALVEENLFQGRSIQYSIDYLVRMKFSASELKSILQKLVRFQPLSVTAPQCVSSFTDDSELAREEFSPDELLCACFLVLCYHPGAFVPTIQRFVSGLESACKRLAVIAVEDSCCGLDTNRPILLSLLTAALLHRHYVLWYPTAETILQYCDFAVFLWRNTQRYNWGPFKKTIPSGALFSRIIEYALLEELRSFDGDLELMKNFVLDPNNFLDRSPDAWRPPHMPIEHFIDQHCATDIAYLFHPTTTTFTADQPLSIPLPKSPDNTPYKALFYALFVKVTGFNPRDNTPWNTDLSQINLLDGNQGGLEMEIEMDGDDWFRLVVLRAQVEYYKLVHMNRVCIRSDGTPYRLNSTLREDVDEYHDETTHIELDFPYVSGMIGHVKVSFVDRADDGSRTTVHLMASIGFDGMEEVVITPDPLSKPVNLDVRTDYRVTAKERFLQCLRVEGCPIRNPPHPSFTGKRIYRRTEDTSGEEGEEGEEMGNQYFVGDVPWSVARRIETSWNSSAVHDFVSALEQEEGLLKRFVYLTRGNVNRFRMPKISRGGGSEEGSISLFDVQLYYLLDQLSVRCPFILHQVRPFYFVANLSFTAVVEMVLKSYHSTRILVPWNRFQDNTRKEYEHQRYSIEHMLELYERKGRRAFFLYLPVGAGKTYVVFRFLSELNRLNQLPSYVVITTPPEAVQTITNECDRFGLTWWQWVPLKDTGRIRNTFKGNPRIKGLNDTPQPRTVTIIRHDHVRLVKEKLDRIIPECFLVVDEVHKTLSQGTQRTKTIYELASTANQVLVMTGTPTLNRKLTPLMEWMHLIAPFPVNVNNFWAAASSMVARRFPKPAQEEHISVDAWNMVYGDEMNAVHQEMKKDYLAKAPTSLGGMLGPSARIRLKELQDLSVRIASWEMVQIALRHWDDGVLVVADSRSHIDYLIQLFRAALQHENGTGGKNMKRIKVLEDSILMERVEDRKYDIVIALRSKSTGYNLQALGVLIRSVYFDNQAQREQMDGRINRIGQSRDRVSYYTVIGSTLHDIIHRRHEEDARVSLTMQSLAKRMDFQLASA